MVAAWMRALTGVGPAMASGSQTYNGICADLPVAPTNSNKVTTVTTATPPKVLPSSTCTCCAISRKTTEPCPASDIAQNSRNAPSVKPKSPMRLTMNALLPALAFAHSLYQKPINAYEHNPTPSQPTNISSRLSASTRVSIAKVNRFNHAKNRQYDSSSCM